MLTVHKAVNPGRFILQMFAGVFASVINLPALAGLGTVFGVARSSVTILADLLTPLGHKQD